MTTRQFVTDALGWGFLLWLLGYVLGIALFLVLPPALIGWVILPIGVAFTLWVLLTRIKGETLGYYVILSLVWSVMAVVLDYLLIVKAFNPADGYYKADVYLYYLLTFLLPLIIGLWERMKSHGALVR